MVSLKNLKIHLTDIQNISEVLYFDNCSVEHDPEKNA